MLDIGQEYAPRYHHQRTGLVEREARTVRELILPLIQEYGQDWEQVLCSVAMVIN